MLDSYILPFSAGVAYGSGALKALQNDNIPELDLLVREAIQNSSDAALNIKGKKNVQVQFNIGGFVAKQFTSQLSEVSECLSKKYPNNKYKYLEIRDLNTVGLTGEVRSSRIDPNDDHGNYYKLVFDSGKEQSNSNEGEAGGSWGYGKSVYYRVGMGLVVFYSQIKLDGHDKQRLIISLMENENNENALLRSLKGKYVGRAWWGKASDVKNEILPVEDPEEIQNILDIFGVKPFPKDRTGTSIIIPFLDEKKLLDGLYPDDCGIDTDELSTCIFKDDVAEYIKIAVQKWYAPKLYNTSICDYSTQKWLGVKVNDEAIKDLRPIFQIVQELYLSALAKNADKEYVSPKYDIKVEKVGSSSTTPGRAGHVAFLTIKKRQLQDNNIIQPYTYLRKFENTSRNDPIVMFARNPGMVLDYKTVGFWVKGIPKPEEDDSFFFAFFVPDSKVTINGKKASYNGMTLGEYLRKCEKSDHMDWTDPSDCNLVVNIQRTMATRINKNIAQDHQEVIDSYSSRLSGKLGKKLLPPRGFGEKGSRGGSSGGGGNSNSKNLKLEFGNASVEGNVIKLPFSAEFMNEKKDAMIGLYVESELSKVDASQWRKDIKTAFPLSLQGVEDISVYSKNLDRTAAFSDNCTLNSAKVENEMSKLEILVNAFKDAYGLRVTNKLTNVILKGKLIIATTDKTYCCSVREMKPPAKPLSPKGGKKVSVKVKK